MMRVVAVGGPFPFTPSSALAGVQGVACITDGADTLVYRDRDALLLIAQWLVDEHIPTMLSEDAR
jgi:hypothetical protein